MGVTVPIGLAIAGYRASVFKEALRAFRRTHSPANFVNLRSVFTNSREGAIVFEECLDRNLIVPKDGGYELTEAGEAVASAKVSKRAPLSRALALVDQLLENAAAFNADPGAVSFVDQIWIFGSVMRREETVGDIDIALTTSRRTPFDANWSAMKAQISGLLSARSDVPEARGLLWSGERWLIERAPFGKRRHPLLAGVHNDVSDLKQLGVPCKLIFDRQRGGRVYDDVVPRYPDSLGRSNEIMPPRTLPDFTPGPLRPMDGRWVAGYQPWGAVSPHHIFGSWSDAAHALYPAYPEGLRVIADGYRPINTDWTPKRVQRGRLDGRERVVICNQNWWGRFSLVLHRQIIITPDVEIRARFEAQEFFRVRSQLGILLDDVASTIALILAVDAERALRRQMELGRVHQTRIVLDGGELKPVLAHQAIGAVKLRLNERMAKIEPDGWTGPLVTIDCVSGTPAAA